ncbi:GTP pyrophosphokinase [Collimonas fungivorans]|uniref:GTP pyrophosphokinase n=1 Tax=Collimonas fungivorans TaxID=158899 RepID=UPI0006814FFF|nr:hypothetical protein [Collimonas fungivorans]
MDLIGLRADYENSLPTYQRAAKNIREAIELFLGQIDLQPLAVLSRVKDFESFAEKVQRKNYSDPFTQTTDFVGIRVVLYFSKDIEKVEKKLQSEFNVLESENKSDKFEANEFGYRSHHLLIKIPAAWAATPNYRDLGDVAIEVQLRTVMMHAWAEIEHKLQYKSKDQVPKNLQRRLFLLSAKVEEADDQFEQLEIEIRKYRKTIADKVAQTGHFDKSLELNLDAFKEFLSFFYPGKYLNDSIAQSLFDEITTKKITFGELEDVANAFKPFEKALESLVAGPLSAPGYFGYALDVIYEKFWEPKRYSNSRNRIIEKINKQRKAFE